MRSPPAFPATGSRRREQPRGRGVQSVCALLSRVEIISAVLIRLTSGSDSSLLVILSVTYSYAREFFPLPLSLSLSLSSLFFAIVSLCARIPIFRTSLARKYITRIWYDICCPFTVNWQARYTRRQTVTLAITTGADGALWDCITVITSLGKRRERITCKLLHVTWEWGYDVHVVPGISPILFT